MEISMRVYNTGKTTEAPGPGESYPAIPWNVHGAIQEQKSYIDLVCLQLLLVNLVSVGAVFSGPVSNPRGMAWTRCAEHFHFLGQ